MIKKKELNYLLLILIPLLLHFAILSILDIQQ
jgi:hypothetical protein